MSSSECDSSQKQYETFEAMLEESRERAKSVDVHLSTLALLTESSARKDEDKEQKKCQKQVDEVNVNDDNDPSRKRIREDSETEEDSPDSKRMKPSLQCASPAVAATCEITKLDHLNLHMLPTELIQQIFTYATNLRLHMVHPRLHAALDGDSLKIKMLVQAFSFFGSDEVECRPSDEAKAIWTQSSVAKRLASKESRSISKKDADLLSQRWFTAEMFQKCQWLQLSRSATQALQRFTAVLPVSCRNAETKVLEEAMKENFAWGALSDKYIYRPRHAIFKGSSPPWKATYGFCRADGATFKLYMPDDRGLNTTLVILVGSANEDEKPQLIASAFPVFSPQTSVPRQLLNGPWTQQQGAALETFINACPWSREGDEPYSGCRLSLNFDMRRGASLGLKTAIRAWCAPAARILLGTPPNCPVALSRSRVIAEDQRRLHPQRRLLAGWEKPRSAWCRLDCTNPAVRLDSKEPWRAINEAYNPAWKRWFIRTIVEKEHLQLVLREGPVGRLGWAWFHWLGAHARTPMWELRDVARSARHYVTDPARLEMIDALEQSHSRYYTV